MVSARLHKIFAEHAFKAANFVQDINEVVIVNSD